MILPLGPSPAITRPIHRIVLCADRTTASTSGFSSDSESASSVPISQLTFPTKKTKSAEQRT